jgi:DNA polymerase theta
MTNPATVLKPRMAFLAARGCVLISADYSQIELRMLAHFSADPLLCDALKRDEDVFQTLAATWRRVAIENVTRAMRDEAKQLAYAVLYGQSIAATAQQFAISTAEADKLQVSFLNTYPGIRKFLQESKDFCKMHGYIETLLRRRRHLPGIHSRNIYERLQAERQSVNSICQGSAAEVIKLAMINIHSKLEGLHRRIEKDSLGDVRDCRLVLQIYDELIFEVKEQMVTEVVQIMKDCMEGALRLNVPLKVHVKVGTSWGALA